MKKLTSFLTVFLLLSSSAAFAKSISAGETAIWLDSEKECSKAALLLNRHLNPHINRKIKNVSFVVWCDGNNSNVLVSKIALKYVFTPTQKINIYLGQDGKKFVGSNYIETLKTQFLCKDLVKWLKRIAKENPSFHAKIKCEIKHRVEYISNKVADVYLKGKIKIQK